MKTRLINVIFYLAIFLMAVNTFYLARVGINEDDSIFLQFASLIGLGLLAFGMLYQGKLNKRE